MSQDSWNKGLDDAASGASPNLSYAGDGDYQDGYAFADRRHESYQQPPEQPYPTQKGDKMSDMIFCPYCNIGTSDAGVNCEHCGQPIPPPCSQCNGEGYWDEETGGCDSDGENDTRETYCVTCPSCQGSGRSLPPIQPPPEARP